MRTPVEGRNLQIAKCASDKTPGVAIVENDALETDISLGEWLPTVKTLVDISGYRARIMPILHDDLGYRGSIRGRIHNWSSFSDEIPHVPGAEAVVSDQARWII